MYAVAGDISTPLALVIRGPTVRTGCKKRNPNRTSQWTATRALQMLHFVRLMLKVILQRTGHDRGTVWHTTERLLKKSW